MSLIQESSLVTTQVFPQVFLVFMFACMRVCCGGGGVCVCVHIFD